MTVCNLYTRDGRCRLQEYTYQCVMSQYFQLTESTKIISLSIYGSKNIIYHIVATYPFLVIFNESVISKPLSIKEDILLINTQQYIDISMHRYLICTTDTHFVTLRIVTHLYITVSPHLYQYSKNYVAIVNTVTAQ